MSSGTYELKKQCCKQVDPAIFYWLDRDCNVAGVLTYHVADFILGWSHAFVPTVILHLQSAIQVGREEHDSFHYVGMEYVTANVVTCMHQENHIRMVAPEPCNGMLGRLKVKPMC